MYTMGTEDIRLPNSVNDDLEVETNEQTDIVSD